MTKNEQGTSKNTWKIVAISAIALALLLVVFIIFGMNREEQANPTDSTSATQTENALEEETYVSSIDEIMSDFSGSDEEVIQVCELELNALGIDYVSIDQPLEGDFIYETRVGTYELNAVLRTPSTSSDMPQPKSTEMLCTIFPGDEYPVEITFGKDW